MNVLCRHPSKKVLPSYHDAHWCIHYLSTTLAMQLQSKTNEDTKYDQLRGGREKLDQIFQQTTAVALNVGVKHHCQITQLPQTLTAQAPALWELTSVRSIINCPRSKFGYAKDTGAVRSNGTTNDQPCGDLSDQLSF